MYLLVEYDLYCCCWCDQKGKLSLYDMISKREKYHSEVMSWHNMNVDMVYTCVLWISGIVGSFYFSFPSRYTTHQRNGGCGKKCNRQTVKCFLVSEMRTKMSQRNTKEIPFSSLDEDDVDDDGARENIQRYCNRTSEAALHSF